MFQKSSKKLSLLHGFMRYPLYICLSLICLSQLISCAHVVESKEDSKTRSSFQSKEERVAKTPSHILANRLGNKLFGRNKAEDAEEGGFTSLDDTLDKKNWTPLSKESTDDRKLIKLQAKKAKDARVTCKCQVYEILKDDLEGRRHQRFLVLLSNKTTVLVAHNMDLAPRVPLKVGDVVEISGEYIWNPKGGVIHYTHHSTNNRRHKGGSITLKGKTYN